MVKVGTTQFARGRHTPEGYSHFDGTWPELEAMVEERLHMAVPGNRKGVLIVQMPPARFYSSVVPTSKSTPLVSEMAQRREDEGWFIQTKTLSPKCEARYVEVILYANDLLGPDAVEGVDLAIVSVNASPTGQATPMDPVTMARNFLELPGGTKCEYTAKEFAEAIIYWSQHCHRA